MSKLPQGFEPGPKSNTALPSLVRAIPALSAAGKGGPPQRRLTQPAAAASRPTAAAPPAKAKLAETTVSYGTHRPSAAADGFSRIVLPSGMAFYDSNGFLARPLKVGELARLTHATSVTEILDALANAVTSMDIRDLTAGDFRMFLYWMRKVSLPNTPFTVYWTSRYGNSCELQVTDSVVTPSAHSMTRHTYLTKYVAFGVRVPTMRDAETIDNADTNSAAYDGFMRRYAQYVALTPQQEQEYAGKGLDWFGARIAHLEDQPSSFMELVRELEKETAHGVKETFEAQDTQFEPKAAEQHLRQVAARFRFAIGASSDADTRRQLEETANDRENEANDINHKLSSDLPVTPRKEVVTVSISVTDFFP